MKESLKKLIILLIIILIMIIIFIITYAVINNNDTNTNTDYSLDSMGIEDFIQLEDITTKELVYENNRNTYYTIMSIITRYIDAAALSDTEVLMDMFDDKYINEYNINETNLSEIVGIPKLENDFEYYEFNASDVYSLDNGTITIHFIYGSYYNIADMEIKELNLMLELDNVNETFNIYNYKYMKDNKYDELKIGDSININIDKIENRNNNEFKYLKVSEEEMAKNYLYDYKNLLTYDREKAYETLDEEYSKLKFQNLEEFDEYVENKKVEYFTANLKEYKVETSDKGEKTYICKDENDNYYYFIEKDGILRYTVILDNYVISNEDFINQYNKMNEQEKVIVNIQKFIMGINEQSYYYAYSCLADSFKNNYFKTQAEFESYVKENFYESNTVEYEKFDIQGDVYTYSVILTDKETNEQKNKTFIMQLKEGTEFVLSFDR